MKHALIDRNKRFINVILVSLIASNAASSEKPFASIKTISFEKILVIINRPKEIINNMLITLLANLYISLFPFLAFILLKVGRKAVDIASPTKVNIVSGTDTAIL